MRVSFACFQRGISGSDCVYERADAPIQCVRWAETASRRDAFWGKFGLDSMRVDQPGGSESEMLFILNFLSAVFRSLYYMVLLQLFLFLLDIGATLVMCCRYKAQKDGQTLEKRVSLALSGTICELLFKPKSVFWLNRFLS